MALRTKAKIDPEKTYVAITMFHAELDDGTVVSVREGERLLGSRPAVQGRPQLFLPDSADDAAHRQARAALLEKAGPPMQDPKATHIPDPIPAAHRLVATTTASYNMPDGTIFEVHAGRVFDGRDPRVQELQKLDPTLFLKVSP